MSWFLVLAQAALAGVASPPSVPAPLPIAPAVERQGLTSLSPSFFIALNATNALDMVGKIPGFTLDTGASVRGFEGAAGNVLVDGQRPSSKADSIDQVLQRIPIGQVERIDVIRGGAPGIDMQGKTVLANVIRKKGGSLHALIAVADGVTVNDGRETPSMRLEASGAGQGRAWEIGVRGAQGVDTSAGPGPEIRIGPSGRIISQSAVAAKGGGPQWVASGSYEAPLLAGQFRINGRYFIQRYDDKEIDDFSLPMGQVNTDHFGDHETDTELGGRYSRALGARADIELVGLRTTKAETVSDDFRQHPGPQDLFELDRYSTESIGRGVLKFRQTEQLSWEAGGEVADNTLDSRTNLAEDGTPEAIPAANVEVDEKRSEVFAKAIWRPNGRWTAEGAVRQESSTITSGGDVTLRKSLSFTKPRLSVVWAPAPVWQLRFRLEREVGQLNFDDFVARSSLTTSTVTAGNPNLNPQQDWVAEAAMERTFWGQGSLVLTARHYELTDALDRAPIFQADGSFFDATSNIGSGTKDEYVVALTLPLDRLGLAGAQFRGDLTRRYSQVIDPTTHRPREISNLHPVDWDAHFSQPLPAWNANWGIDVVGGSRQTFYRADAIEDQKSKPLFTPFIEWKIRPNVQLHLEIQNITEVGFRDTRQQFAGVRSLNGLAFVDDRNLQFGRGLYFRLRKFYGA